MSIKRLALRRLSAALAVFLLAAVYGEFLPTLVSAATLTTGSEALASALPSATGVAYTTTFSGVTLSSIECISIVYSNAATGGSLPTGMTTTGATFDAASTYVPTPSNFVVNASTNGTVILSYATGATPGGASGRTVVLDGITNGSTAGTTYYAQFNTYTTVTGSGSSAACSGSLVDTGTVAYEYTTGQAVSLTVNPSLTFAVGTLASSSSVNGATTTAASTANAIPFGTVTTASNGIVGESLTVSENGSGYTVYTQYTGKPTSGANQIADWTGTNASPTTFSAAGTEAFGYTTASTTLSGTAARFSSNKWAGFTTSNAEIAHNTGALSNDATDVAYQVGIGATTHAGTYTTTVVLTATPTY